MRFTGKMINRSCVMTMHAIYKYLNTAMMKWNL
jgi:hypothetical protein